MVCEKQERYSDTINLVIAHSIKFKILELTLKLRDL